MVHGKIERRWETKHFYSTLQMFSLHIQLRDDLLFLLQTMPETESSPTHQCVYMYACILNNDSLGNDIVLVLFSIAVMKRNNKRNLKKKFTWQKFWVRVHHFRKVRVAELEATSHIMSADESREQ